MAQPWKDLDLTQDKDWDHKTGDEGGEGQGPEDPKTTDDIEKRKNEAE